MSLEWRKLCQHQPTRRPRCHPAGIDPAHFHLVAPYIGDAEEWHNLRWPSVHSDETFGIMTRATFADGRTAWVQPYGDVIARYRIHPEAKSVGPDAIPCGRQTVGLLQRRPVTLGEVVYVGKETNRLAEVEAGAIHDWNDVQLVLRASQEEEPEPRNATQPANTCQVCGGPVDGSRVKYCSSACKQHAYRRRLRASLG